MAALINHVLSKNRQFLAISSIRNLDFVSRNQGRSAGSVVHLHRPFHCDWHQLCQRLLRDCRYQSSAQKRYYPKKNYKQKIKKVEVPECRKLQSTQESFAARGFLRSQKEYEPKENYETELKSIYNLVVGDESQDISHSVKFELFNECFKRFNHSVPNSILHTIKRYDDLLAFYGTPVSEVLPLDKLKTVELPPNLHIQHEPLRFHPDEDTMFKGQTAFPKSNTLVTGIRTKKKYKGCKVVENWPGP